MVADLLGFIALIIGVVSVIVLIWEWRERRINKRERQEDERKLLEQEQAARYEAQRAVFRAKPQGLFYVGAGGGGNPKPSTAPTAKAAVAQTRAQQIDETQRRNDDNMTEMQRMNARSYLTAAYVAPEPTPSRECSPSTDSGSSYSSDSGSSSSCDSGSSSSSSDF